MSDFVPTLADEENYLMMLRQSIRSAGRPGSVSTVEEVEKKIAEQETKVKALRAEQVLKDSDEFKSSTNQA